VEEALDESSDSDEEMEVTRPGQRSRSHAKVKVIVQGKV
jgi:hypothetical protein